MESFRKIFGSMLEKNFFSMNFENSGYRNFCRLSKYTLNDSNNIVQIGSKWTRFGSQNRFFLNYSKPVGVRA